MVAATAWRRWLAAIAIAGVVLVATVALFRWPRDSTPPARPEAPPAVILARNADELLTEEAALRDPTPLFLPTRWNAGENALLPDVRRDLGSSFRGYEPKWSYTGLELTLPLPPAVEVPQQVAEVFATDKPGQRFSSFGQRNLPVTPLAARGAYVEIASAGDGRRVLAEALADAHPPAEAAWQPMEFIVGVKPSGVVEEPVVTRSSQVAAIDSYFRNYLMQSLHVGQRLPPGFYRVEIGP